MQQEIQKSLSCRKFVIRHLRIFVSDGMANERKESRRSRIETLRDDRPLLNNGYGFTLIELLVVVLIIGILAAVAVPQYQLAVDKSRIMPYIQRIKDLDNANEIYYMANGKNATNFSELDIDLTQICPSMTAAANGLYCKGVFFEINPVGDKQRYYLTFCPKDLCSASNYYDGTYYLQLLFVKGAVLDLCRDNNQIRGKRICNYLNSQFK